MKFNWSLAAPRPDLCGELARALNITPLLAQCLANRGLVEPEPILRFLHPRLKNLGDPFLIPNMAAAVERLLAARQLGQLLVIFGDYDVDGVASAALLIETLSALGWRVECYLPHRLEDGYGLSREGIEHCLQKFPVKLLLAVDCGSTAVEVIGQLRRDGIDVIVLDHHQVSNPEPAAVALVNPQLGADFRELCSAGLAFKLVHALLKRMREQGIEPAAVDLRTQLDLVALGTIADVAPLVGENRILVTAGLERLNATRRPGLLALKKVAGSPAILGCYEVGFQLAPRLNAAGRLEDAHGALQLLLTRDPAEAESLAARLDESNRRRREIERGICDEMVRIVRARFDAGRDFVIVEGRADWHIGVVGIVASRVLQEFYRPTVIFGGDGQVWRGSGRSIEGFDLAAALRGCEELLLRHGGHAMAAGLSIHSDKVDILRQRLNGLAQAALRTEQLQPCVKLDAEVVSSELGVEQIEALARLAPLGQGNPTVRLALRGLSHRMPPRSMGRENQHLKLSLTDGRQTLEAVWWNAGNAARPENRFDIAFTPEINEYKGRRSVRLKLLDWRPCGDSFNPALPPR
ncbi:MAG TPA: single-stranded-DNA-specific exonuclease RecJ [Candidatus Baltobacteraceae bacterium]|jgi:single-stranded-DNA-specific exonuclease|nr:single-stranded-DNA-specific exonuclease RecJ [Candidatus Baltobacteraceae bacterium]